jgi:hypothetical protein
MARPKVRPGLYIHKTRPRPIFFSQKLVNKIRPSISARAGKVNKIRPYLFIHIFNLNLNDEYCNEFYLIYNYYYLLEQKFIISLLCKIVIFGQYKKKLINYFYFFLFILKLE